MTALVSFLLIGESDVGKTHYGAQILRRLDAGQGAMTLVEGRDITPFKNTMDRISQGRAGQHTPSEEVSESRWTIRRTRDDRTFELNWPDYAGETLEAVVDSRRVKSDWQSRIAQASGWALMVRPTRVRVPADILTRQAPLNADNIDDNLSGTANQKLSAQSRFIEILQMLRYRVKTEDEQKLIPPLCILLSCYDELETKVDPRTYCKTQMPMLSSYIDSNWKANEVQYFGVSQLGQPLSDTTADVEYVDAGPETQGYVIGEDGSRTSDLLTPIDWLLTQSTFSAAGQ